MMQKNISYHKKLERLNHQLALSENLLQRHPLVKDKLTLLQNVLHHFNLQTEWTLAGPLSRFLMILQTALLGQETSKSKTGFIGPALNQCQQGVAHLINISLPSKEKGKSSLLLILTQLIALGVFYLSTQLRDNWKQLFLQNEPPVANAAVLLLRELGLTFVLGSRTIDSAFQAICHGLGLQEKSQQKVTDIGMCYLCLLTLIMDENDTHDQEEFYELVKRLMQPKLDSIEMALLKGETEHLFDDQKSSLALNQFQLMRQVLNSSDFDTFKRELATSFERFGLPFQEVQQDIKQIHLFCSQLNETFKNINYQTRMATTTVIQAA